MVWSEIKDTNGVKFCLDNFVHVPQKSHQKPEVYEKADRVGNMAINSGMCDL